MSLKTICYINYINLIQYNGSVLKIYDKTNIPFIINTSHYGLILKFEIDNLCNTKSPFYFFETINNDFSFFFNNFLKNLITYLEKPLLKDYFFYSCLIFNNVLKYNNFFLLKLITTLKKHFLFNIFFNI